MRDNMHQGIARARNTIPAALLSLSLSLSLDFAAVYTFNTYSSTEQEDEAA